MNKFPGWMSFFAVIGVCAFVGVAGFSVYASMQSQQERTRYNQCLRGERTDCEPSLTWMLMAQSGDIQVDDTSIDIRDIPQASTSPLIESVALDGLILQQGVYTGEPGTIMIRAVVRNADELTATYEPKNGEKRDVPLHFENDAWRGELPLAKGEEGTVTMLIPGVDTNERTRWSAHVATP